MPENVIPRSLYDVRFLEIPDNTEQNSLDSYIASQIHSIYPGNNGAYEYVYRLYNDCTAIIVFITKEVLSRYSKTPPVVPIFLLTSINLKQKNVDVVFLYKTDVIEKIIFQDSKPVRSQLIDRADFFPSDNQSARWLFIDKPDSGFNMPNSDMILKLPRFSEQHRYKSLQSSKSLSFKSFFIMLLILLMLISGISFRYSQVLKQEISDYKKQQNQVMIFSSQKAGAEKEIDSINALITELDTE
ncbi:MAG TPA: hypothetical protein DCO79_05795, partial [Spirochaeta sp.]|nr:hypothetical protein [Spirochaeta sp.]